MNKPVMLMVAGFGDNPSMFAPLHKSVLAQSYDLRGVALPGFGAPSLSGPTNLDRLAQYVADVAKRSGATSILAHSVASIIATLAAQQDESPLKTIFSLEGNLTAEDAYFSGTAANYQDPALFRAAFLKRLEGLAEGGILARYRQEVTDADPQALWELGRDARGFSDQHHPGVMLQAAARAIYLYNPENCPQTSLTWLGQSGMEHHLLPDASHWPSLDQPSRLADTIKKAMG